MHRNPWVYARYSRAGSWPRISGSLGSRPSKPNQRKLRKHLSPPNGHQAQAGSGSSGLTHPWKAPGRSLERSIPDYRRHANGSITSLAARGRQGTADTASLQAIRGEEATRQGSGKRRWRPRSSEYAVMVPRTVRNARARFKPESQARGAAAQPRRPRGDWLHQTMAMVENGSLAEVLRYRPCLLWLCVAHST